MKPSRNNELQTLAADAAGSDDRFLVVGLQKGPRVDLIGGLDHVSTSFLPQAKHVGQGQHKEGNVRQFTVGVNVSSHLGGPRRWRAPLVLHLDKKLKTPISPMDRDACVVGHGCPAI